MTDELRRRIKRILYRMCVMNDNVPIRQVGENEHASSIIQIIEKFVVYLPIILPIIFVNHFYLSLFTSFRGLFV